jgi:transposase-like protein
MKEQLKELIRILSHEKRKKELLREVFKTELKSMAKDVLQGIAIVGREAFCQQSAALGNGYYPRGLAGLFGRIEGLRVPRTMGGGFRPFFLEHSQRTSYELKELVVAMYQGGCKRRLEERVLQAKR